MEPWPGRVSGLGRRPGCGALEKVDAFELLSGVGRLGKKVGWDLRLAGFQFSVVLIAED